jgi:hypothetical protein
MPFDPNQYLKNFLSERNKSLGLTGKYVVVIRFKETPVIAVHSLGREAAERLFAQLDESSAVHETYCPMTIHLYHEADEIDMNRLPNIHSKFIK